MARSTDLTKGNITRGLWGFALPLMLGNIIHIDLAILTFLEIGRASCRERV